MQCAENRPCLITETGGRRTSGYIHSGGLLHCLSTSQARDNEHSYETWPGDQNHRCWCSGSRIVETSLKTRCFEALQHRGQNKRLEFSRFPKHSANWERTQAL